MLLSFLFLLFFFFFNDPATTEIYTLSLHDALPIPCGCGPNPARPKRFPTSNPTLDRKSTRQNSSHANISYAVFCLKKKKKYYTNITKYNKKKQNNTKKEPKTPD